MANQLSSSGKVKLWENPDLRKRFLFLLGALIVFRIGAHVPVPGVDAAALAQLYKDQGGGILGMLNMFSGGSLERFSIFAIGIMPYISASIIMIQEIIVQHCFLFKLCKRRRPLCKSATNDKKNNSSNTSVVMKDIINQYLLSPMGKGGFQ